MQFRDRTIVRLSDPTTRAAVLDEIALEQILAAAYDTDALPVNGPFTAVFDQLRVGYAETYSVHGEGQLYASHGEVGRLALTLADWQPGQSIQADAFWRGAVVARTAPDESTIESLDVSWTTLARIDPAVAVANGGALPADPQALEAARRVELAALVKADLQSPDAFGEARLERLLGDLGVASVGQLLDSGTGRPSRVAVAFSAPLDIPASPRRFPVAAALLLRETPGIADLLLESKSLRNRLAEAGVETPPRRPLPLRQPLLVIWVVPVGLFDDEDWPGGAAGMNATQRRAARRARAGRWLAREGIGLAVVAD